MTYLDFQTLFSTIWDFLQIAVIVIPVRPGFSISLTLGHFIIGCMILSIWALIRDFVETL